ncbi:tRNA:m(4)X modification enzyme TRM13-like protein [Drosera capensis]
MSTSDEPHSPPPHTRCQFFLPKKNRFCANSPLGASSFCGNHTPRPKSNWIPCPIDPSHAVLEGNLEGHVKRCPMAKRVRALEGERYFRKGVNKGREDEAEEEAEVSCGMKRKGVHGMRVGRFWELLGRIKGVHGGVCEGRIRESFRGTEACAGWIMGEVDRKLPYQEKHVLQQASILGNLEDLGVLKHSSVDLVKDLSYTHDISRKDRSAAAAVVEFGAGRGYLTQMLADCYGIKKVFLVERKSYKLKADRSLRQKETLVLERLRIDIEDLDLSAVQSLKEISYLAIGKHLCGLATDLTLRCCLSEGVDRAVRDHLCGLAVATCCHHLSQWKHYPNKAFMLDLGFSKEDFHAIIWFTSWAVDDDHGSGLSSINGNQSELQPINISSEDAEGVEEVIRGMKPIERAAVGFMCKDIIDIGRMMWIKEQGMDAELVQYVPSNISPENRLLIARHRILT